MMTKEEIFEDLVNRVRTGDSDLSWPRKQLMELVADKLRTINDIVPDFSHIQTLEDFQQVTGYEIAQSEWQRGCRKLQTTSQLSQETVMDHLDFVITDGYCPGSVYLYCPQIYSYNNIFDVTFRSAKEVWRIIKETAFLSNELNNEWDTLVRNAHKEDHMSDLGDAMVMAMLKNSIAGHDGVQIEQSVRYSESCFRVKTSNGSDFSFYLKQEQLQDIKKVMEMTGVVKDLITL